MPKIVAISDTHSLHEELYIPPGDILVHCGDYSAYGNLQELLEFNQWLGTLGFEDIIVVSGNHDRYAFTSGFEHTKSLFTNAHYLQDSEITVQGVRIYASPYTPTFGSWSFMKSESELVEVYSKIPESLDVLITHGPRRGVLDRTDRGTHAGSLSLSDRLQVVTPKVHIVGHIHEARGEFDSGATRSYNVASLDEYYQPQGDGVIIEI